MPAGVVVVHAVENGCLVFGELPVAEVILQRREAGEGVLTRVSLLLAEADSFVRPQYLRAGKVLNLGGRAIWGGGWGEKADGTRAGSRQSALRALRRRLRQAWPQTRLLGEEGASGQIHLHSKRKSKRNH